MIENFGIGIDISSIEKFRKKPFNQNESFYKKNFSSEEIKYCTKFQNSPEKFAGKFALKEALMKSVHKKIGFLEIETSYYDSQPVVKILGSENEYKFLASISHESEFAVAVVISEKTK